MHDVNETCIKDLEAKINRCKEKEVKQSNKKEMVERNERILSELLESKQQCQDSRDKERMQMSK